MRAGEKTPQTTQNQISFAVDWGKSLGIAPLVEQAENRVDSRASDLRTRDSVCQMGKDWEIFRWPLGGNSPSRNQSLFQ